MKKYGKYFALWLITLLLFGGLTVLLNPQWVESQSRNLFAHNGLFRGALRVIGTLTLGSTDLTATGTELNDQMLSVTLTDVCTATDYYLPLPEAGTFKTAYTTVNGTVDVATVLTFFLSAVDPTYLTEVTGSTLTIAASSAAGAVDSSGTITGGSTITAGSGLRISPDGGCGGTVPTVVSVVYTR